MEAGHPVVAPLEHLRVRGELHGPAASPAHFHRPHVHQLGTHGAAHSESAGGGDRWYRCTQLLYTAITHAH